ncbi:MAG TPA: lipopolysaccharide heptosyltransferase II [Bryobacteraceae bacterium]|nr:lipopolysaccharide heptosyltransferase II [Bryobacteraceae bacterium]
MDCYSKILIRATNWVGDAVMSAPALSAIRRRFPTAEMVALARPWVADIYAGEKSIDRVIRYLPAGGFRDWGAKWALAQALRRERFDCAILLQNAFEAALLARLAGIPKRIGYDRDGRGWLLTDAIPVPRRGDIPRHERFYYLELLRRAGILDEIPPSEGIRLDGIAPAAARGLERFRELGIAAPVIGVSPGAAYGGAKRWLAEGFAAAASSVAREQEARVALFGSDAERALCDTIAEEIRGTGVAAINMAGRTTLREFIDLAAACRLFLTNDSGAMHIASAAGVRTVAIFGATDEDATGPTGPLARVVREKVECSPCLLRECPIDHRCMTRVGPERVAGAARDLLR